MFDKKDQVKYNIQIDIRRNVWWKAWDDVRVDAWKEISDKYNEEITLSYKLYKDRLFKENLDILDFLNSRQRSNL